MVIYNETVLTPDEAIGSLKKISKRNYMSRYIYSILLLVFGITIIILSLINKDLKQNLSIGGSFIAISFGFIIYNIVSITKLRENIAKRNPEIIEYGIINSFTFKEESFSVICKIGNKKNKYEFKYLDLPKIVNEDKHILFFVSTGDLIVCKKDSFKSKKEEDLFFYGLSKHKIKIKDKMKRD